MKIFHRTATRLSVVLVVIIFASAVLMVRAITSTGTDLLVSAATQRLTQDSRLVSVRLQDIFDAVQRDVEFIAASPAIADLVDSLESKGKPADEVDRARQQLQDMFAALLNNHPWYVQIRMIGTADDGREVVRVDQGANGVTRTGTKELQQKGEMDYFMKTLDEPPGKVFWSAIELNREHGRIAEPAQPVLRAAMPLGGKYGAPVGIVVINLDIRRVFDAARSALPPDTMLYIANTAGDYLYHPDPARTFGFERGQRYLIQHDFTDSALNTVGSSSLVLEDVTPDGASEPVIAHLSQQSLKATGGDSIIIALTRPRAPLLAEIEDARQHSITLIVPFILVALVIVIWMVELIIGPLDRVTREVNRYAPGRKLLLPEQNRKDEVGQLAQAFARMVDRIDEQLVDLHEQGQRFRSLFEAVPDAVIIIDEDGSIEYSNPATEQLFGYWPDELHGQNVNVLMPEPYHTSHDRYIRSYLETGVANIIGVGRKVVGKHKNGHTMPLYLSIGEFTLRGRHKFTGILHDISLASRGK